jgi:hypothetical protein
MITDKIIEEMAEGMAEALNYLATKAPDAPGLEGDTDSLTLLGEDIVQAWGENHIKRTIIRTQYSEYSIPDEGEQLLNFLRKHHDKNDKFPSITLEGNISSRKLDRAQFNALSDEQEAEYKRYLLDGAVGKQFKPCDCTPLDPRCDCGKYSNETGSHRVKVGWHRPKIAIYRIKWKLNKEGNIGDWDSTELFALSEHSAIERLRDLVWDAYLLPKEQVTIIIGSVESIAPPRSVDQATAVPCKSKGESRDPFNVRPW